MPLRRHCQIFVLVAGCLFFSYALVSCSRAQEEAQTNQNDAFVNANSAENQNAVPVINPDLDFSDFKHENPNHERLPCLLCHKREDNSPTPKLAGHLPCSGCHVQQFADNKNQICTICHTNAETGDLKGFPALNEFNVQFDHAMHQRETNCATCHKPATKAAMSIPARMNAHSTCFQCHTPEAKSGERDIGSCATCHQPGTPNLSRYSAKAFAFNFTHANHRKLNCAECHNVQSGAARGRQVSTPQTAMHFPPAGAQSCASCHNNKRTFGGDDFSSCRRCHTGKDFQF